MTPRTTLQAGATLDAAVAEKVMKWPTCRDAACGGDCGALVSLTANGWHVCKPDEIEEDWSPSTDANDMMDVLAELHRQGVRVRIHGDKSGEWFAELYWLESRIVNCKAKGPTLQSAVCRAALAWAQSRQSSGPETKEEVQP